MTLGFHKGGSMKDPDGLMEGEGRQMRHIRFSKDAEIDEAQCAALLKEAVRLD